MQGHPIMSSGGASRPTEEQQSIYNVDPIMYSMANGTVTMDEAILLWVLFLHKNLNFPDRGGCF